MSRAPNGSVARSTQAGDTRLRALYLSGVLGVFLLDQTTKLWAISRLPFHEAITVIPRCFHLAYTPNRGGAFGILRSLPPEIGQPLFIVLPGLILVALLVYSLVSPARARLLQWSLAMILGGALGNLADRIRLGYVVDFILWHWDRVQWPAFNVADSFITAGIGLLLVLWLLEEMGARRAGRAKG